ncbi:ABC transporter permease [Maribacter sp.]|uniref:ABC transporter permease n=1 Tax=Maribacter sp. TaxID=1897614 RepID=UPI0025C006AC|nr:ABC transporter permease [Maribacter sp.]
MFRNHLKIAWRSLIKNRIFTGANVFGLTVAFAVAILLSMAAFFELSYDQFHKKKDAIYQVYSSDQTSRGTEIITANSVPFAPALKNEVPGIKNISRALSENVLITFQDKELNFDAEFVDSEYFAIFSFTTIQGNSKNPIPDKNTIAITEKASKVLFGSMDPIGKTVTMLLNKKEQPFTIASVLKNIPTQSTIDFDVVIPFENHPTYLDNIEDWDAKNHPVYIELDKSITPLQFEKSTFDFTNLHFKNNIENLIRDGAKADENGQFRQVHLTLFKDISFTSFSNNLVKVDKTFPYLVLGIAFLILFIASANFINMSIATSSKRLKEIGMRKTLGAIKGQLFVQFWLESVFVFMISASFGILLSYFLLEPFQTLFRTKVSFADIINPMVLVGFFIGVFGITFIAGGYPALLLSKLGTLQALKGKLGVAGKNGVRNTLIIIQFAIAIILISCTLVLQGQLQYMRNKDLGFNKEQVISIPLNGKRDSYRMVELLRNELQNNPNILNVTGADNNLGRGKDGSMSTSKLGFDYKEHGVTTNMLVVDYEYAKTLELELVAGRTFSKEYKADNLSLVINETMARELNESNPLNARIVLDDSITYSVIGVVKDYNFQGLNKRIEPLTLFMDKEWSLYYAYVKIAPKAIVQSYDAIKEAWKRIEPNAEFQGSFLDENLDRTFAREKTMTTIITCGSIIGIVLSCIGLLAISLLMVSQRTKEIGIRKVVGASVSSITVLLTKDFLKLVGIAFVIATPISWYMMNEWLQEYAFHVSLSIWFFIGAGFLTCLLALITIGGRTIKAASVNPVKSLRTE